MIYLPCITSPIWRGDAGRATGCRVHDEHLSSCRGIRVEGGRAVECEGCLPQPAVRGLLCASCAERFDAALEHAVDVITHTRSIERAPVPEGPRAYTPPGPRSILPVSWLTADDVWADLHELAFRCDPLDYLELVKGGTTAWHLGTRASIEQVRDAVQLAVDLIRAHGDEPLRDEHLARLAVRFYRGVQRALGMYPFEELAHPIAYAKCRDCGERTLERRPPLDHLEPITVRCVNPSCGAIFHPALVEFDLATYRTELEAAHVDELTTTPAPEEALA